MSGERASTSISHPFKRLISSLLAATAFACVAQAQVPQFGSNPQHTSNYATPVGPLNRIRWQVNIDDNPGAFGHYGAPIVTAASTIITSHKTASNGFVLDAYDSSGVLKYTVTTDYVLPSYSWVPVYQACLVGTRMYFPGSGGKIFYIDNVDASGPHTVNTLVFYGDSNYNANPTSFINTVFINTPITADSAGNIFFGYRIQSGPAPAPFSSSVGGFARISSTGVGSWTYATDAANDATMLTPPHSMSPALSNDEQTLYVYVRGSSDANAYICGLDPSTLARKFSRRLWDPRSGDTIGARVNDVSTASPMVGPDGDVYAPIFANPYNGSRGFLLHYSGDLSVQKTTGAFGWDYTPAVVPASMVPSYHGPSSYLLFCKYNNYFITDGDGINRVAILDPNATQVDFHSTAPGLVEMREVLSIISPTPDNGGPSYPLAVREWCINACAVNPSTNSIIFNNEDGRVYRWNTADNVCAETVRLNDGIGQPYVPTVVGPGGIVYTLNGGNLFALGSYDDNVSFSVTSDLPNMRSVVAGTPITFSAKVNGGTGTPSGTFDFFDDTYNGLNPEHNTLATGVAVDVLGNAQFTTSALSAGGAYFGNHRITAVYSGDGGHSPGEGSMLQKVHAYATSIDVQTSASPANYGDPVTITVTVTSGGGTPTGYVAFDDNGTVIGQVYLDGSGQAQFTTSSRSVGSHSMGAVYESDTYFASSGGGVSSPVQAVTSMTAGTSPNPSTFGQTVTLSADVSSVNPAAGIPTGSVTWKEGATVLGTGTVNGSGHASATISTLSVGSHAISAEFTGSGGYVNTTASAGTHNVTATTSTAVGSSPNPSFSGQSVTFTATVTSGGGTPTGSVVFTIDGSAGSSIAVDGSGQATFNTSSLSVGSHTVSAAFTGTGGFGNSSGSGSNQVVKSTATSTSVISSLNPSVIGQSVTFTATVTSTGGTPTGSVAFKDGATTIATVTLDGTGHAATSTSSLTQGSHAITANFTGTGVWQNSSGGVTQVVNADTTPPSVPTGVSAAAGPGSGKITISWSASTDPDDAVNHYELWRSNKLNGGYSLIASPTGLSYLDNVGKKQTRYYYVIAVDSHGNKSAASVKVSATAPNQIVH